ncbi:MAG: UDP-N-acetylmuramate--L-alanine ligase, partial [Flavobacteriales bacterium]|nr:UDP-N-acetylmuramate--L-alanine ligase [Flavobacteriales bacterium]MCB0817825.1 UDP-N-acetylmuramate--L-alanine ligase [Flavobacteriales bacterium]
GFAKTLAGLDRLVLLPIYPAREEPLPGIDAQWLLDQVPLKDKLLITRDEVPAWVDAQAPDVLLTLGAGDIDRLVPDLTRIMQRHAS